jgi:hypothetical protein
MRQTQPKGAQTDPLPSLTVDQPDKCLSGPRATRPLKERVEHAVRGLMERGVGHWSDRGWGTTLALLSVSQACATPAKALDLAAVRAYATDGSSSGWNLQALARDLEREHNLLRGRVDGLEAQLAEFGASAFSTTTILSGKTTVVLGANSFGGTAVKLTRASRAAYGATALNTDLQLTLQTSFNGKDQLRANLRAGNFATTSFGGAGPSSLSQLEVAFQESLGDPPADGRDALAVDRLFYQWPLGAFTITAGGRVGQNDMLAIWPSVYPAETVLDVFTLAGSPAAYSDNEGPGAGIGWQSQGFAISANYVAANGAIGKPSEGGLLTSGSAGTGSFQVGYGAEQWALAVVCTLISNGNDLMAYGTNATLASFSHPGQTTAYAVSGYWQPATPGWIPSISAGWGLNTTTYANPAARISESGAGGPPESDENGLVRTSQSWSVGVQWQNAGLPGNVLGMAVGQPTFATRLQGGATPRDGNVVVEGWYKMQLTDNISFTPAFFYLSRPLGEATPPGQSFRQVGGLIKTTWRF